MPLQFSKPGFPHLGGGDIWTYVGSVRKEEKDVTFARQRAVPTTEHSVPPVSTSYRRFSCIFSLLIPTLRGRHSDLH